MLATEIRSWTVVLLVLVLVSEVVAGAQTEPQDCLVRIYLTRESDRVLFERQLLSSLTIHETAILHGAVVDPRGYIASYAGDLSEHLEDPKSSVLVETADGGRHEAVLLGVDERISLAVLYSEATRGCRLKPPQQAPSNRLLVVSSIENQWRTVLPTPVAEEETRLLPETRFKILNPGFKAEECTGEGGFLFANGRFSGIITHISPHQFSPKLAVLEVLPAAVIERTVARISRSRSNVKAGWLGVYFPDGDSPEALVSKVVSGSPADRAGLQSGDLIRRVDGHRIQTVRELSRIIRWRGPNQDLALQVVRRGRPLDVQVRLLERQPQPPAFAFTMERRLGETDVSQIQFYRTVLPPPLRLGLLVDRAPGRPRGLLVRKVLSGSPAERAGLRSGDIILRVGGEEVAGPSDFVRFTGASSSPVSVQFLRNGEVRQLTLEVRD